MKAIAITRSKFLVHFVKTALVCSIFFALIFAIYFLIFLNKTLPNTYFASLNISGKSKQQVEMIIANYLDNYKKQKIKISVGSKTLEVSPDDLGITFSEESSLSKVYERGQAGNFLQFIEDSLKALIFETRVSPVYSLNYSQLSSKLNGLLSAYESVPRDSTIIFEKGEAKISKSANGVVVDRLKLVKDIASGVDRLSTDAIAVSYIDASARITENEAQKALARVKDLNNQNIVLYFDQEKWPLSADKLLGLLEFFPSEEDENGYLSLNLGDHKILFKDVSYLGKKQPILEVKLNNEKINSFIDEVASEIDKPTVDAIIEFDGQKVTKFTAAQDGQTLNRGLTKNLILEKISVENISYEKDIAIKLPVATARAKIANKEINNLGIKELIASGVSYFAGSIPNRAFNIGLGSSMISGTIVKPGDIFSFDALVGPVSASQGFKQGYIINKGHTVLDDGGGICQVSTTVFRAALNAGLPIVKRTAHAYRVAYYEQHGFKPGLDATVFSPSVDFQFKNDTDHHILVQVVVDQVNSKLQVDIYGTRDGRKVEISDPIVSNVVPAPEPLHQDDPTLPKGVVKQVDFAASGATSVFNRKVYKNGELTIDESFKSNFRPWQAVYLVGTGG